MTINFYAVFEHGALSPSVHVQFPYGDEILGLIKADLPPRGP